MSRIETLKKQFPHLNVSLLDLLVEVDGTKSHKYTQLLCKLFSSYFESSLKRFSGEQQEIISTLNNLSVPTSGNLTHDHMKRSILALVSFKDIELFQSFKEYMEKGLIKENDITKYSDFSQLSSAVSLAELKEFEKLSELKIHKEFEDDKWLLLRPLSFEASSKYGAGTKWCTTFKKEKEYFFKYCQNGMLVYMINKESGEKFAMFYDMTTEKPETSFWTVEDTRTDITDLEIDYYIYDEVRKIKKSKKRNIDFLDNIEVFQLATECSCLYRLDLGVSSGLEVKRNITLQEPPNVIRFSDDIPTTWEPQMAEDIGPYSEGELPSVTMRG